MERAAPAERQHGPGYLEPGGLRMLRRRLPCYMDIDPLIECFGREAAEYTVQTYKRNPLISAEPLGKSLMTRCRPSSHWLMARF